MKTPLEDLTQMMLEAARRAGADGADAIVSEGSSIVIDVRGGELEQAERSESVDLGLRVLVGQKQANVSSSDARPETIAILAERAVAMAREAPEDPYIGLAASSELAADWDMDALALADPSEEPSPESLQEQAVRAEAAGMVVDGVSQIQSATAAYGRRAVHHALSNGFSARFDRTDCHVSCSAIAGTGNAMERDHDADGRIFASDLRSPEEIGTLAGVRAVERVGARKPPTGAFPVLFDERISSSLIGHLLNAANGSAVARGASWLRDRLGEQILPSALSVVEDPFRPRVSGSRPFDGEGLASQYRTIVEDGILRGWTLDLANARKLDMAPTGNGRRGLSGPPTPGLSNIALTQGAHSRDDLIGQMGTGLLVTSMIGSTINPNTGDYSRGASGFWVENGQITYPVNECTIAGSLPDFLMRMVPANDARGHLSSVVPSLLVEGLTLAGA